MKKTPRMKREKWDETRINMLSILWRKNETACPCCGKQMFFREFESIPAFIGRAGLRKLHGNRVPKTILEDATTTIDHIHPLSKGGENKTSNYLVMCRECNSEKAHTHPINWMKMRRASGRRLPKKIELKIKRCAGRMARKKKAAQRKETRCETQ